MKFLEELKEEKLENIERQVKEEYWQIRNSQDEIFYEIRKTEIQRRKNNYKKEIILYKILFFIGCLLIITAGIMGTLEEILGK